MSWQKDGKSVYGTEEELKLFTGDFRRGTHFKGTIELDEEEVERIKEAEDKGIKPVFDLYIIEGDRRRHRR